jgi:2-phospho-L-lactate transferase/gluconeogenesis factor (CofD/UPF0052 family)
MRRMRVAIFCGGRGSQYIIRELLRWDDIDTTLLVNAYDDGLSTGALRQLIPGMLGPSDFRKNLSYLLGLYSPNQFALQKAIEYRFPMDFREKGRELLRTYGATGETNGFPQEWLEIHAQVETSKKEVIRTHVAQFMSYLDDKGADFDFADCSFGNIIFAGMYLANGESFNRTSAALAKLVDSQANLCNVSKGEDRTLTAVKEDGQILTRESEVVGKQSAVPIRSIFFTKGPIPAETIDELAKKSLDKKLAWFRERDLSSEVSDEARAAIRDADVIIYGPGTQHSSLFPSYIIAGDEIRASPARIKAFVANLHFDHDIQGFTTNRLVDHALRYLGDEENASRVITHVIAPKHTDTRPDAIAVDQSLLGPGGLYKGAKVLEDAFQSPSDDAIHSGHAIIGTIRRLFRETSIGTEAGRSLDIFVDLQRRSLLADTIVQEFSEIDWSQRFDKTNLTLNRVDRKSKLKLPPWARIEYAEYQKTEPQIYALKQWLRFGTSEYLITISGDGEYRMHDLMPAISVLDQSSIGAIYGSRAQSRDQFRSSLTHAYGDSWMMRSLSRLGKAAISAMFLLRHGMVFSDPMTGVAVYRRSALSEEFKQRLLMLRSKSSTRITSLLIKHDVQVCEMPVSYHTYPHFTDFGWRVKRGMRNLAGLLG